MATADKLNRLKQTKADLKAALTEQGQTPGDVFADYPDMVRAIRTGTALPTLTTPGEAADLRKGKQLLDQAGQIVTGTLEETVQATPSISVSSSGLITATAGDKSATKQLSTQGGKTVTPGTSSQTAVASGRYTTGAVNVAGDANLVPENIKSGVSIFGVPGSLESGGGGWEIVFFSTDSRYPSSDVFSGEYENDLESSGYLKMNLRSDISISEYKFLSVCAVYEDYLLTLMITEIPEPLRSNGNVKLGAYYYDEADDTYFFDDFVKGEYYSVGDWFSITMSGTNRIFSPDHVYAYIAIKRA